MIHNYIHIYIVVFVLLIFVVTMYSALRTCPYTQTTESFNINTNITEKKEVVPFTFDNLDVYLINMDKSKEKLAYFTKQWKASDLKDIKFNRLRAVNGNKLNISTYLSDRAYKEIQNVINTGYRTKHYQLTRGAIGCYLSHLKCYDKIANGDKHYGIIFEDDVNIPKSFHKLSSDVVNSIPGDWDILLLSCHCITCKRQQIYSKVDKFIWLHCYVVTKSGAKKLVEILNSKPIEQQIDSELSDLAEDKVLKIYCVNQSLSTQSQKFATSIQMPMRYVRNINPYARVAAPTNSI